MGLGLGFLVLITSTLSWFGSALWFRFNLFFFLSFEQTKMEFVLLSICCCDSHSLLHSTRTLLHPTIFCPWIHSVCVCLLVAVWALPWAQAIPASLLDSCWQWPVTPLESGHGCRLPGWCEGRSFSQMSARKNAKSSGTLDDQLSQPVLSFVLSSSWRLTLTTQDSFSEEQTPWFHTCSLGREHLIV